MEDPILFWTIISAVGQVLGSIATAAAVIVSLWIVLSERKPKLRISAGLRLIINGGGQPATDVIEINIANIGQQRVTWTAIGWRTGYFRRGPAFLRRELALQNPAYLPESLHLPITLEPGEQRFLLQDVEAYRSAIKTGVRESFFCRRPPWSRHPKLTRVEVVISLAAHNGLFKRVEPNLAHFLATGRIEKGAKSFNEKAVVTEA